MQKISESTNTANPTGEFTEGNPAAGAPATLLKAAWLNTIQRELAGLVLGAGISLNANDDEQVLKAVKALAGTAADFNKLTNKPTTLSGYGITDGITVVQMNAALAGKATKATTLGGYGITDALSSAPQGVFVGAIADIAKHDIGTYAGPTTDKPTAGGLYVRWKYPGANTLAFDLYAHMASGADTFGFRRVGADGTYVWREVFHSGNFDPSLKADKSQLGTAAALTSTVSTTDSTLGRALRVGDFGWGAPTAVTATDANLIEASGIYSIGSGTLNVPAGAGSGSMLLHMNYTVNAGNRTATQEVVSRSAPARKFWRARVVDVWGAWVEAAASGVNSSITALTGLTARPSFGGNLAWDAGNFDPSSKINKDQSQAVGFFGGAKTAPYLLHADGTFVYLQVDRPKDTALLSANGWSKNADTGEIIQWCEYAIGDAQGATSSIAVTWPFQFPTQCLNIRMSFRVASGSPSRMVASSYPLTLSGTTVLLEEATTAVQAGLVLMIEVRGN